MFVEENFPHDPDNIVYWYAIDEELYSWKYPNLKTVHRLTSYMIAGYCNEIVT